MKNKIFLFITILIIIFGFLTHIFAISGNRIFFTVDEGRDAVYIRQILNYHQIFTKGPQSSIAGLYSGPLWYYFASIGYIFTKGNPTGAVLMLISLNLATTLILMFQIKKQLGIIPALLTGFGLQILWPFFTTSLWGFNPFPLVALSIFLILLLIKNKYAIAVIPIILAFNAELAGATALLIFYIAVGFYLTITKVISWKKYIVFALILPALAASKIVFDFIKSPKIASQNHIIRTLAGTNFKQMAIEFSKMLGQAALPQNFILGFIIFILILTIFIFKAKQKNIFTKKFVYLTITLISLSYLFFSSNHGWKSWHTVFIPPLVFISLILMLSHFKKLGLALIAITFAFQIFNFTNLLIDYTKPSPNPSLLSNQLKVLNWIYTKNEGNGFDLYTYTNSFYDYSYQYLISWYAKPKYGFYPCEYSNFPLSIKTLYIPGWQNYVEPKLGCDKFRFLIIDSDTNGNENKNWINDFRNQTILLEETHIGQTKIEKRKVPDKISS